MLQFYDRIDIQNPQLIADRVIHRIQKNRNYPNYHSIQQQKYQHQTIQSLKEELNHMQTQLHNLEIQVKAFGSAESLQQKLMKRKNCRPKQTTIHACPPYLKMVNNKQNSHQRSFSCDLHDGSVMKKILYQSEPSYAHIRRSSSVRCNYDDLYQKQENKIARTATRSPQGRSKIGDLIKRDKSKFYS